MSTYVTNFLSYLLTEQRVAHNTYDAYKRDIAQLEEYAVSEKKSVHELTHDDLIHFLATLKDEKMSSRTMARKIACFKNFFSYIYKKYGLKNSAEQLETPKLEKRLPNYLQEQEISALFAAAHKDTSAQAIRNATMLIVLYSTGVRITELVQLKVSDFDIHQQCLKVTGKGSKERLVPLPAEVMQTLQTYITLTYPDLLIKNKQTLTTSFLFPTYYEGALRPMTRQSFWMYLKKIAYEAGVKKSFSPHTLRHSLATHLLKNGVNLRSLQILLGHEQLSTVQVYTHVDTTHLRKIYDKKHPRS